MLLKGGKKGYCHLWEWSSCTKKLSCGFGHSFCVKLMDRDDLSRLVPNDSCLLLLSQIRVLSPCATADPHTELRYSISFHICTEMGVKCRIHKASTPPICQVLIFTHLEQYKFGISHLCNNLKLWSWSLQPHLFKDTNHTYFVTHA